jgi:eukaryotic-like serine/threonine-protein kinase
MTAYPAAGDYYKAVQAPSRTFTVPTLQAAQFVWDSLGPTLARGSSAVVFQASVEGKPQALRCYIRNDASSRDRYSALNTYLASHDLSPYVSGATWLDEAIVVNRTPWPVLTMEWIDGRTLNEYVDFLVTGANTAALTTLAGRWRELVALLQRSEFGHGDLQHGNVMVDQEGQLRLVDFDGVWIPQLASQPAPSEFGHPNYQHPGLRVWDRWLDTFSALVIYLSLTALGREPALWLALYNSKNLLFAKNDFFAPFETEVWKQLAALRDPQIDVLTQRLRECCAPDWVSAGSLEMLLDQPAPSPAAPAPPASPARPPIPAGQRWWEQPATGTGTGSGTGTPSRSRPQAPSGSQSQPGARPGAPSSPSPSYPTVPRLPGISGGSVVPGGSRVPTGSGVSGGSGVHGGSGVPGGPATPASPAPPAGYPAAPAGPSGGPAPGGVTLPTPPPLSTPLSTAGTGPLPQLSQKMVPPGDTIWWSRPEAVSGRGRPGPPQPGPPQPGPYGSVPPAPVPQGYGPYPGRVPPGPGPSFPVRPAPAPVAKPQQSNSVLGAIALGLGIVFLIVGAASSVPLVVLIGLGAGAWGIWRLVTATGNGPKPPGGT